MNVNVMEYGAIGDGAALETAAIQRAIDACAASGGGKVTIPAGRYRMGSVHLASHMELHLESGAYLLGDKDLDHNFDPDEVPDYPLYQDESHSYFHHSLLWGENLEHVVISGHGVIDMQSAWEKPGGRGFAQRGAKIIALRECKNVTICDLTLKNATDLAVYLAGCETVRVTGITADVHIDGISPDCCRDVVISDCIVRSGDDAIVPKSSYTLNRLQICENVVITNCVVSSRCNAIKLGTESNGGFRNFTISNCTIFNTRLSGIALEIVDGGILEGVNVSNITMQNVANPIFVILADRARGPEGTKIGTVRDIQISNVTATGPYGPWKAIREKVDQTSDIEQSKCFTSSITGQPGKCVENVRLSNIRLLVPGGGSAGDAKLQVPEDPKGYPECSRFGDVLPAYGLYCRHTKGLQLHNVSVEAIEPDGRPGIILEDETNTHLREVEGRVVHRAADGTETEDM